MVLIKSRTANQIEALLLPYIEVLTSARDAGWRLPGGSDPLDPDRQTIQGGLKAFAEIVTEEGGALAILGKPLAEYGGRGRAIAQAVEAMQRNVSQFRLERPI
ncbi:MAG TPA: hypothetical protein VH482_23695 [Thermomicrobiales bacterium]|jgi:hypothetical protein